MAQFAIDEILTTGIQISGFIFDYSSRLGTPGQVLTSTSSGVMWQADSSNADLAALSGQIAATGTLLNNRINSLSGYANDTFLSGSGTQYYVPRWNTSKELVTGSIYDNGFVGIGITNPSGQLHLRNMGFTSQSGIPDSNIFPNATGVFGLVFDHNTYTNGQYRHRLIKVDRNGNLPLYLQQAGGVANQYINLARFGTHTYSTNTFEVFGDSRINGTASITSNLLVTGNVGIGTANPAVKLHIENSGTISSAATIRLVGSTGNNAGSQIEFYKAQTPEAAIGLASAVTGGLSDDLLLLSTNPNSIVLAAGLSGLATFKPDGKVGIGIYNPISLLSIGGAASTSAVSGLSFGQDAQANLYRSAEDTIKTDGSLVVAVNATFAGNVGIGTTGPLTALDVRGRARVQNNTAGTAFYVQQDDGSNDVVEFYRNTTSNFILKSNGNVGIGLSNPAVKLDVSGGNARFSDYIIVGEDLAYPSNTGSAYLGYTANTAFAPQSNLELIDALSNAIGVNDPLRFRTTISGQYFSGNNWYADPAPLSYRNLLDGNATSYLDVVTSSEYSVGISGKRFVVDQGTSYTRPNFILLNTDWSQNWWGFKLNVENSNDLVNWTNCITEQNFSTNNTRGTIALSIANSIQAGGISRYFRFSFVANQAITAGSLRVNKIRSLGNQYYSSYIPVSTSSTGHLIASVGIISPTITSLSGNLATTGSTLDSKINSLSGYSNANFATILNLAATGSTLDTKINSLSGYSNANFATILNLAATGSTLDTKINTLSGYTNSTFLSGQGTASWTARWNGTKELITGSIYDIGTAVGIGTLTPSTKLAVEGGSISTVNATGTDVKLSFDVRSLVGGAVGFNNAAATNVYGVATGLAYLGVAQAYPLVFTTNGIERLRIAAGGNVGIGSTNPAYKLDVNGTARVGDTIYVSTATTSDSSIEIGYQRAGNGSSYIDLIGDATYTDYGLRLIRDNGGPNTTSLLKHRGTGILYIATVEAAPIFLQTTDTTRLAITSGGNVGIGTTIPAAKLEIIHDSTAVTPALYVKGGFAGNAIARFERIYGVTPATTYVDINGNGGNAQLSIATSNNTFALGVNNTTSAFEISDNSAIGTNTRLLIDANGSVGINTTSPTSKLHVVETTATGTRIQLGTASTNALMNSDSTNDLLILNAPYGDNPAGASNIGAKWGIKFIGSTDALSNSLGKTSAIYAVSEDTLGYNRGTSLAFYTNQLNDQPYAERMRIYHNGNVGIGITNPLRKLHISSSDNQLIFISGSTAGTWMDFQSSTSNLWSAGADGTNGFAIFNRTTNANAITVANGGNVGIGTTNPTVKLHITNSGTVSSIATVRLVGSTGNNAGSQIEFYKAQTPEASIGLASAVTGGISDDLLLLSANPNSIVLSAGVSGISVFKADGKVGIGTINPQTLLSLGGLGSTSAASGLTFGGDAQANLYRSAEDTIKTDGSLVVNGNFNTNAATVTALNINAGLLPGIPAGSTITGFTYAVNNGNVSQINLVETRFATGSDWTTASTRIQKRTDVTNQAYIEFNPSGASYGMALGVGAFSNVEALRILSNGSIGIGTTNPATKLHVYGAGGGFEFGVGSSNCYIETIDRANTSAFVNTSYYTRGTGYFAWYNGSYTERMRIASDGNVGIGTTSPALKLQVVSDLESASFKGTATWGSAIQIEASSTGGRVYQLQSSANGAGEGGGKLLFVDKIAAATRLAIVSDGNVGIGTTAPVSRLHIYSGNGTSQIFNLLQLTNMGTPNQGDIVGMGFAAGESTIYGVKGSVGFVRTNSYGRGALTFYTNNTAGTESVSTGNERVRIQADGNVGIGTNNALNKLSVIASNTTAYYNRSEPVAVFQGTSPSTILVSVDGNVDGYYAELKLGNAQSTYYPYSAYIRGIQGAGIDYYRLEFGTSNGSAASTRMTIASSGNVGIGTTNPITLLSIGGPGSTAVASGITFGADASSNLYRDSSASIRTDGGFLAASRIRSLDYIQFNSSLYPNSFTNPIDINIGNVAANAWQSAIRINPGSYVGIGTTQPSGKLHIVSTVAGETVLRADGTNGTLFSVTDDLSDSLMSVNNSAGLPVFEVFADDRVVAGQYGSGDFVLVNNKVGIGRTSPGEKLDVNGSIRLGVTNSNTIGTSNTFSLQTQAINIHPNSSTDTLYIRSLSVGNYQLQTATSSANGGNLHLQPYGGNVAIGLTSPQKPLDVLSSSNDFVTVGARTLGVGNWCGVHFGYREDNNLYRKSAIVFERTDLTSANAQGKVHILNGPQAGSSNATLADSKLTINEAGNVGIGVTNPIEKLTVVGNIQLSGSNNLNFNTNNAGNGNISFDGTTFTFVSNSNSAPIIFSTSSFERVRITNVGRVGIGTNSPTTLLSVGGPASTTAASGITFGADSVANLYRSATSTLKTDGDLVVVGNVNAANIVSGSGTTNYVTKWNGTKSVTNSQIFDDGTYVGINTAVNTTYRLQVNGSFAATTKSFDIVHPTISGKRLTYASLEGPENGVYYRGQNNNNEINLPHYWSGLVHEDSLTVNLTAVGKRKDGKIRNYSVDQIGHNKVYIYTDSDDNIYNYYYTIFAERKDVSKLVIERDME